MDRRRVGARRRRRTRTAQPERAQGRAGAVRRAGAHDDERVGQRLLDAHRAGRQQEAGLALEFDHAAREQALAQAGHRVEREVDHHRARAGLRARVNAHHARRHLRGEAVDLQARPAADGDRADVLRAHRGAQLEARHVDDLEQARVDADALARLHEALRHLARERRADLGVGQGLARELGRRARGQASFGGRAPEPAIAIDSGLAAGDVVLRGSVGTLRDGTPVRLPGAAASAAAAPASATR